MLGTYSVKALPALSCDDGMNAQQRQENAEALRVAQGFASPPLIFLCRVYAFLSVSMAFYTFLCVSMRSYAVSIPVLCSLSNTGRLFTRHFPREKEANRIQVIEFVENRMPD
jgi:hypothetical protein